MSTIISHAQRVNNFAKTEVHSSRYLSFPKQKPVTALDMPSAMSSKTVVISARHVRAVSDCFCTALFSVFRWANSRILTLPAILLGLFQSCKYHDAYQTQGTMPSDSRPSPAFCEQGNFSHENRRHASLYFSDILIKM